jgi:hypothetical protein
VARGEGIFSQNLLTGERNPGALFIFIRMQWDLAPSPVGRRTVAVGFNYLTNIIMLIGR